MASVQKEIIIDADPAAVWTIISDFTDGPIRMAPGFVTDSRLEEPDVRVNSRTRATLRGRGPRGRRPVPDRYR